MQPLPSVAWRQGAGGRIAGEDDDRVGGRRGDVDARAVAADRQPLGRAEGDAGGAAAGRRFGDATGRVRRLGQRAGGRVAVEDGDRVAEEGADVDVLAVGADDDHVRAEQRAPGGAAGQRRPGDAAGAAGSWRRAPVVRLRRKTVIVLLAREVA